MEPLVRRDTAMADFLNGLIFRPVWREPAKEEAPTPKLGTAEVLKEEHLQTGAKEATETAQLNREEMQRDLKENRREPAPDRNPGQSPGAAAVRTPALNLTPLIEMGMNDLEVEVAYWWRRGAEVPFIAKDLGISIDEVRENIETIASHLKVAPHKLQGKLREVIRFQIEPSTAGKG